MQSNEIRKGDISRRESWVAKGSEFLSDNRLDLAEACYKKAIELYPEISSYLEFNLSLVRARRSDLGKKGLYKKEIIEPDLAKALGLTPEDVLVEMSQRIAKCEFRLESVGPKFAVGWAVGLQETGTVILSAKVDDKNYAIIEASGPRPDVQKTQGGDGYSGYRVELNEYVTYSKNVKFVVAPISHRSASELRSREKQFTPILKGEHFVDPESVAKKVCSKYLSPVNYKDSKSGTVSVIILNLNGSAVLKECVQSLLEYNESSEIIVVDHSSTDGSVEMLYRFKRPDRIKVIQRDKNYSYSCSNNLAAKSASGDILVFLNNDIILTEDSISEMAKVLSYGEFGLVGLKLWDMPRGNKFSLNEGLKYVQHYGVNFRGVARKETLEAFELRQSSFVDYEKGVLEVPALTAAAMSISKSEFESIGGFDEDYFYGQEDVDLCLRYGEQFNKKLGVIVGQGAFHIRGLSRKTLSKSNKNYMIDNRSHIQHKRGPSFRRNFRKGQFEKPGFWNQKPLAVAMVVSEVGFETDKADFFTAKELGDAFAVDNTVVGYFDKKSDYDVSGYDIVIVYIEGFDPRKLKNISPHAKVIAWARNWFDRWCDRPWIEFYDCIYASSEKARACMQERLKRSVVLLRIAASNACIKEIKPVDKYKSDYVFTGSYFNSPREITEALSPEDIPFEFKLFGHNWEQHKKFSRYTKGAVSYKDIPSIYASTLLVVDDANVATKKWGSLNCRFFDALASGKLCITNNSIGVNEVFGNDDLVYDNESLNNRVKQLLSDDKSRCEIACKYKEIILSDHTYSNRKKEILSGIYAENVKLKIAIKISAPDFERAVRWGDYHFAIALRRELELLGYSVRIDCLHEWHSSRSLDDDINIVLRGLDRFKVRNDQINILWLISHPDLVCEDELRDYDSVFIASELYASKLRNLTSLENIYFLPQASMFDLRNFDKDFLESTPKHKLLFVGNSRNQYREVVRFCVEGGYPITVYGEGWEQFIPNSHIGGAYIDNSEVPYYYHNASVVLNDHWLDMKRHGFVSNRVFDVLMSGGNVVSDYVEGADSKVFERVLFYKDREHLYNILDGLFERVEESSSCIVQESALYSFTERARVLDAHIKDLV